MNKLYLKTAGLFGDFHAKNTAPETTAQPDNKSQVASIACQQSFWSCSSGQVF